MPRDIAFSARRFSPADLMLPEPSPSAVWARARQAFGIRSIDQLPLRARLLDVLEQLEGGHLLAMMGVTLPTVWLDGNPDIALLAGVLFTYGYVEIAGRHRHNPDVVFFSLSDAGRRKLREGRAWWNRLTVWQRLRIRLLG